MPKVMKFRRQLVAAIVLKITCQSRRRILCREERVDGLTPM
jgi:hypothetical protein